MTLWAGLTLRHGVEVLLFAESEILRLRAFGPSLRMTRLRWHYDAAGSWVGRRNVEGYCICWVNPPTGRGAK